MRKGRTCIGAAIEGRANPTERLQPILSGRSRTYSIQEEVGSGGLTGSIGRSLGHLPMRPYLRVIGC